jgi:hypothetical protein
MRRNDGIATLEFPTERAVLERGEERVQLRQRRALRRLQLLHRSNSMGEFALQLDGGQWQWKLGSSVICRCAKALPFPMFCMTCCTRLEFRYDTM